jgi:hypothetical protein
MFDESDTEAAALSDLTDDLNDAADSESNVVGGGCFSVLLLIFLVVLWTTQ